MTGAPYAAYARVRAVTRNGPSAWSSAYGFNIHWKDVPKQAVSYPGLVRWTPVEGATSYQVWFTGINHVVESRVNAVDEREFYAFHQGANFTGTVNWRVRAVRRVAKLQGFITPVNYGPWSQTFTSTNPAMDDGVVRPVAAMTAMATSTPTNAKAHEMTPAFVFTGSRDAAGNKYGFYRVYVFSDRQCVNTVLRGVDRRQSCICSPKQGPAQAAVRPKDVANAPYQILVIGDEGRPTPPKGLSPSWRARQARLPTPLPLPHLRPPPGATGTPVEQASNSSRPQIELLESDWPNERYFWTVVPVKVVPKIDADGKIIGWY